MLHEAEHGVPPRIAGSRHLGNERTAALMPNGWTQIVDTGHFVWMEQPGVVEAAMRDLLSKL